MSSWWLTFMVSRLNRLQPGLCVCSSRGPTSNDWDPHPLATPSRILFPLPYSHILPSIKSC